MSQKKIFEIVERILHTVHHIERQVERLERQVEQLLYSPTPTNIVFKERNTMALDPVAGNTLVYTGTLAPAGAAFPAGTTFSLVSSDPTVTPTVDATGLIVTIPLPSTFVDNPASPFNVVYTASGITPSPAGSPTTITATITPSVPAVTPTGISFVQTT